MDNHVMKGRKLDDVAVECLTQEAGAVAVYLQVAIESFQHDGQVHFLAVALWRALAAQAQQDAHALNAYTVAQLEQHLSPDGVFSWSILHALLDDLGYHFSLVPKSVAMTAA